MPTIAILAETEWTQYGPYGFSFVLFLAMWRLVLKPLLDSRDLDIKSLREIADVNNRTAASLSATANALQAATASLERTSHTLAGMATNAT
jgi:hypothetical protein